MSAAETPQVFLIDDDASVLTALGRLLSSAGYSTRTFLSPLEFLSVHDPTIPGCAVIDVGMDMMSGIALQERLVLGEQPRPIIFLTACQDVRVSVQAMKAGALDYLSKPVSDHDLLGAVQAAVELDRRMRAERDESDELRRRYRTLTSREREVMGQIIRGRLNKQIAFDLGIVEKTAKVHRGRVMEKMRVRSVAGLVSIAERLHLQKTGED